jgi:hypothetical protein
MMKGKSKNEVVLTEEELELLETGNTGIDFIMLLKSLLK